MVAKIASSVHNTRCGSATPARIVAAMSDANSRFHVAIGGDVKDVTLTTGATMPLTFGTRILSVTLKSINPQGANVRLEAKGDW